MSALFFMPSTQAESGVLANMRPRGQSLLRHSHRELLLAVRGYLSGSRNDAVILLKISKVVTVSRLCYK